MRTSRGLALASLGLSARLRARADEAGRELRSLRYRLRGRVSSLELDSQLELELSSMADWARVFRAQLETRGRPRLREGALGERF